MLLIGAMLAPALPVLADTGSLTDTDPLKDATMEEKTVIGEVVTVTKRAISVEYETTATSSTEMLLPVSQKTEVDPPLKKLFDVNRGDRVSVRYQEWSRQGEDGQRTVLKKVATKVKLIRSAYSQGTLHSADKVTTE